VNYVAYRRDNHHAILVCTDNHPTTSRPFLIATVQPIQTPMYMPVARYDGMTPLKTIIDTMDPLLRAWGISKTAILPSSKFIFFRNDFRRHYYLT
jgi:hypothetical protein